MLEEFGQLHGELLRLARFTGVEDGGFDAPRQCFAEQVRRQFDHPMNEELIKPRKKKVELALRGRERHTEPLL